MYYKEDEYKYEKRLLLQGYVRYRAFPYDDLPEGFDWPLTVHGWPMRNAIKQWAENEGLEVYKIVRGIGYWRDLHGDYVYEVWAPERRRRRWSDK